MTLSKYFATRQATSMVKKKPRLVKYVYAYAYAYVGVGVGVRYVKP